MRKLTFARLCGALHNPIGEEYDSRHDFAQNEWAKPFPNAQRLTRTLMPIFGSSLEAQIQ
jgi:hypothetical protein